FSQNEQKKPALGSGSFVESGCPQATGPFEVAVNLLTHENQLNAAVLVPSGFRAVVGDRIIFAVAFGIQPVFQACGLQIIRDRLSAALRKPQIVAGTSFAASVPLDLDVAHFIGSNELLHDTVQNVFRVFGEFGGVVFEINAPKLDS